MKEFWKKWYKDFLASAGILSIGFLIRIYNLTLIPVFVDEAIYIRWAQVMRAEQNLRFLPLSDGKQPLFMWVVIPFLKIFEDPLFAGRIVSVLTGLGTLIGIFVLSLILFRSKKVSFVASLIYAISPFSVFFDRFALADSMLSMFGVWALIFMIITVRKIRLDTAMLAGFSLGGALLTKSPGVYFSLLTPTALILSVWPKNFKEKLVKASIYLFLFTSAFLIAFGLFNILRLGSNFQMIAIRNRDYVYPISHIISSPLDPLRPFLDRSREYFFILGPLSLVLLILLGIFRGLVKFSKETLLLFLWGFLPILISSEFSKTMTARYIYFSIPYFVVLASSSFLIFESNSELKSRYVKLIHFRSVLKLIAILFIFSSLYLDFKFLTNPQKSYLPRSERSGYLEDWTAGYGIKEVSEYVRGQSVSGRVVVGTEGYFGTLPDGLQIYLNDRPDITVIGVGEPVREMPKSLIESKKSGNYTYLVVNSTRMLANPEALGLDLIAAYPKAIKPDGSQESLLLFEVK